MLDEKIGSFQKTVDQHSKEIHMTDGATLPEMRIQDSGWYVKIKYRVRIVGGPVLKGLTQPEIMDFVTGYRQVIPGLEKRLISHAGGETLSFTVPAEEAFGARHNELEFEKNKADFHFPAGMTPYPGMELPMISHQSDAPDTVIIKEIRDDTIVIDCNHPLSGKDFYYDLEILEARPAKENEVCGEWEQTVSNEPCHSNLPSIVLGQETEE
jgi:FKBP-type peptidyl-prolyl cis-trans isomerase 2